MPCWSSSTAGSAGRAAAGGCQRRSLLRSGRRPSAGTSAPSRPRRPVRVLGTGHPRPARLVPGRQAGRQVGGGLPVRPPLRHRTRHLHHLLMSIGLTFGTISATYGYTAGIIDRAQFSVLVTVVVLTAVLPTAIAQRFFSPPTRVHAEPPSSGGTHGGTRAVFRRHNHDAPAKGTLPYQQPSSPRTLRAVACLTAGAGRLSSSQPRDASLVPEWTVKESVKTRNGVQGVGFALRATRVPTSVAARFRSAVGPGKIARRTSVWSPRRQRSAPLSDVADAVCGNLPRVDRRLLVGFAGVGEVGEEVRAHRVCLPVEACVQSAHDLR